MALRLCVLGSGSSGNATLVASDASALLIDAGFSGKEMLRRLEEVRVDVGQVQGICVSHEHNDHIVGLRVLHKRHGIPVYGNAGTIEAITNRDAKMSVIEWNVFSTGSAFRVGDLVVEPFSVPHDAYEPVGFIVAQGEDRVGIATDMGMATSLVRERLRRCRAVVVESNYDEGLLQEAERPWHLKQRIQGRQGHLSNRHAASMIVDIARPTLRHVFLAHLSEDCNRHDLAVNTMKSTLGEAGIDHIEVNVTYPDRIGPLLTL